MTEKPVGSPIADSFAVVARDDNALLVLADGVNWGEKSRLAARAAVHGCVDYLNRALFNATSWIKTTAVSSIYAQVVTKHLPIFLSKFGTSVFFSTH